MVSRALAVALLGLAVACASDAPSAGAPAAEAPTPASAEASEPMEEATRPPPSKRMLGRWALNLNDVPKEALAEELHRYKSSEDLANMVRVEYVVTETEWILHKYGAGGVYDQKWHYQIVKEVDDVVVLERIGDDGKRQQIQLLVGDDKMMLSTGAAKVPLHRIR